MLIEKLLLNVLIILMPNFIMNVFFENRKMGESPYVIGALHGITLFLCMIFSFYDYGLFWDLRYVPSILGSLQGGPIAGVIVFLSYILTRTYLGGDALWFGILSGVLAFIVPFIYSRKFWKYDSKKRIKMSVLITLWPSFVMLFILLIYIFSANLSFDDSCEIIMNVLLFGAIQIASVWFASVLNEIYVERKNMKKEIQKAEKLNTLGELAASIAHEIRNPLTVVKGFLQLMHNQEKEPNFQYISLVLSELNRAESIIDDYLNFAKPQFDKIERIHLSESIRNVHYLLQAMATKEGVELECELEEAVYVHTDRSQLKQVLVNLIKNAIEATPANGKVSIKLEKLSEKIVVTISDSGKGMDPEQLERIGTLFYTTKDRGTGLGTSVSLRIIEKMNGTITYKSELGKGTEVVIMLRDKKSTKE
ncbi:MULTISPECIES: ATP-binding protein [unclassified Bacillus (in: firmicutes)]|uniref:ATP-binding protein n=1 Tax=unclassified Bacillus (in: firmicutes) TaxID=185979 RepID=UPI0008E83B53|nr:MULTISPECIES: ATP-binding protein [unclassified Bacillus (in: firmicutes)]SFA90347.1 two-component system, sporulation sensor kinase B [Bacillus sp. UNCCL13]SFQ85234.1 two-component system, sporulation sensor kinase B [Bacillus sp. cl95]